LTPGLPVLKIDTVEEQMNDLLAQERLVAELSALFRLKRLENRGRDGRDLRYRRIG
jgi:hypothetical protein